MIEGLKVTVKGTELCDLAYDRARHHEEREATYAKQIESFKASKVEAVQMTNGDPTFALETRRAQHANDARELDFIAEHIDRAETYLLDRDALQRLGIVASRY